MKCPAQPLVVLSLLLAGFTSLASAQETNITISAEGMPALLLRLPQAANLTVTGNHTIIQTSETTFHIWALSNVKNPEQAMPLVPEIIKGEFVNFKPTATNEITVAGAPARHVSGKGNEADDGDPGAAEVVLFKAGKRVFAACAHGEFDDAARRSKIMLAVLKAAKLP